MISHFFDIDTLIKIKNKVWIISKTNPSKPILKIDKSEFNLIKKGIYKKYKSIISINGVNYFFPKDLFDEITEICNKMSYNINNLSFSLQEYLNKNISKKVEYDILIDNFKHLKNKTDDIYIICSKNTKIYYEDAISKLEEEFNNNGLKIKNYYYLSETFLNRLDDVISYKKIRILIQHLIGLKTDEDKFTNTEIIYYNDVFYYDDNLNSLKLASNINDLLKFLFDNSDDILKDRIKHELNLDKKLHINQVTHNKVNIFISTTVLIKIDNIVKTFESFIRKNFLKF